MQRRSYVLELQKRNRQNPTSAEAILWQELRGSKLEGVRFLRQKAFGRYIADFYCAEAKLVIELDGGIHNTPDAQAYDAVRTLDLEARGLKVIRFQNEMVVDNLQTVLEMIGALVQTSRH